MTVIGRLVRWFRVSRIRTLEQAFEASVATLRASEGEEGTCRRRQRVVRLGRALDARRRRLLV